MKILTLCLLVCLVPGIQPHIFEKGVNLIKAVVYQIIEKTVKDTRCSSDLKTLVKDFVHQKKWAFEMLDASGKVNSGFLYLNFFITGNFDQCLDIHVEKNNTHLDGQYCTVVLSPSSDFPNDVTQLLDSLVALDYMGINLQRNAQNVVQMMKMTYGMCIPASCSISNLQSLWDFVERTFRIPLHLSFVDVMCRSRDRPMEPYSIDTYIIGAFGMYIVVLLTSTLYDIFCHQKSNANGDLIYDFLTSFSLYTNAKKLFSYTHNSYEGESLKCVSGIKVLSILWIILGHRVLINMFSPNTNSKYIFEWTKNIETAPIFAASFAVDTFFALSGLLVSFVIFKNEYFVKKKGLPVVVMYLYRILRLSPALLATIGFYISIFKRLGDGPLWPLVVKKLSASCYNFWWATFFFVSNYIPFNYQCVEQSWFLAVDTQLFLIAPLILKYLMKYPRQTIIVCAWVSVVSAVYAYVITVQNNYGAIFYEGDKVFYERIYLSSFVRLPVFLIGLIMGYITFKYQQISIPKNVNILLWASSLSVLVFLVLIHLLFTRYSYSPVRSALYNSCTRPAWAGSVSLIVFLCVSGHGGVVDKFLSLPIFQVLVRLTYSMYLVHLGVLLYLTGQKKYVGYFSNFTSIQDFIGDLFFIFLVATVWCLAFETPFLNISKIIMQKGMSDPVVKKALEMRSSSKKRKSKKNYEVCLYKDVKEKKID